MKHAGRRRILRRVYSSSPAMVSTAAAAAGVAVIRPLRPEVTRGIALMCVGVAMFPFMNAGVKLLSGHYPTVEIVWARFTGHLAIMLAVFLPHHGRQLFASRQPAVQIGRSLLMLVGNLFFVLAIGHVALATASAIGFTAPLMVTALSVPLLGERVGIRRWSAVLIGFVGALVIIRPGGGFTDPAVVLLLLSAAAYAVYQIATRWVSAYDGAATGIVFTALLGSLLTSLALPFDFAVPRSAADLALFLAIGLFGGAGHYLVIRAFQYGEAAVIAPLGYVELIGTASLGFLIFGNFPDPVTWAGAAIIIASGVYIALRERRLPAAR